MANVKERVTMMSFWWWMATILMCVAAAILVVSAQRDKPASHIKQRFREVMKQEGINDTNQSNYFGLEEWQERLLKRISSSEMDELPHLLIQAGWGNEQTRYFFLVSAWILPLLGAAIGAIYALAQGEVLKIVLLYVLFGFGLTFVAIRRFLRWKAKKRQAAIRKEVVTLLHLLRMLFDAGLSLENILHVTEQQGRDMLPNLAQELSLVLKRIQSGQDRGEALMDMAMPLDVPELTDTVEMLKQVTRYGGNISSSLAEFAQLVELRQVSELREYVSKLSAKMTIVMMLFLFPALIIFLAGPGFMGLARALKGLG